MKEQRDGRCYLCRAKVTDRDRRLPHREDYRGTSAYDGRICVTCTTGLRIGVALVSITDESHKAQGNAYKDWLTRTKAGMKVPYPGLHRRSGLTVIVNESYLPKCIAQVAVAMGAPLITPMLMMHGIRYRWLYVPDAVIKADANLMAAVPPDVIRRWEQQIEELTCNDPEFDMSFLEE